MKLRTLALVAQKGGVGKTTVGVNLAVAAGLQAIPLKAALFDLDGQESAAIWSERRKAELPHVEHITERKLAAALAAGLGYQVYQDRQPTTGVKIDIGESGVTIQSH